MLSVLTLGLTFIEEIEPFELFEIKNSSVVSSVRFSFKIQVTGDFTC